MNSWKGDKRWSDRFLPQIKGILGQHLIGEPAAEEDAERNTDLIVLRMEAVRIACRVRRAAYLPRYGCEFTIRAGRPSGVKTELAKVIEGWGDYLFYGFADEAEARLSQWALADLRVFRLAYMRRLAGMDAGQVPGMAKANGDGSSSFAVFRWDEFPPGFVIGASWAAQKVPA